MKFIIIVLLLAAWVSNHYYWKYPEEKILLKLRDGCILGVFIIGAIIGSGIDDDAVLFRY